MKARQLYALTPRQAFLLQHAISAHQSDGTFMPGKTKRALDEAWQMLSRPIHIAPKFMGELKRVKRTPQRKRAPIIKRTAKHKSSKLRRHRRK